MPGSLTYVDIPIIDLNGVGQTDLADALIEMVVDQSLHIPDMFSLRFADPGLKFIDDSRFTIGAVVKLSMIGRGGTKPVLLMEGEITALEPIFMPDGGTTLTVRGYSKFHRLHFGRKTQTFLKQSDSDIVQKIAREAGMRSSVDNTSVQHDYVIQWNQTDMEFLVSRANRIGYDLYFEKGTLYFKEANNQRQAIPALTFGDDLTSFRVNVTAQQQVGNVVVSGWDAKTKKTFVGQAQKPQTADLVASEAALRGKVKSLGVSGAKDSISDVVVSSNGDAMAMSHARMDDRGRELVEAEGVCAGNPAIKAGVTVEIKGMGTRFSGKYFVTTATHVYTENGYATTFTVNGRRPYTVHHLLDNGAGQQNGRRIDGVVPAIVTNNKDPDDMGRVKVKFPWLTEEHESNWARIASPMAGRERGILFVPEINDEVLVAFEHGDPHQPYIVGALWNGKDKPPLPVGKYLAGSQIVQRVIRTTAGHEIMLDETGGSEKITIIDKGKKDKLTFDAVKNEITIEAGGNMILKAGQNITIEAQGNISMEAKSGKVNVKGTGGCNLETPANMTIKGTGQFSLESSGSGQVKASLLQVQGSGPTTIKGNPVMIN